MRLKFHQTPPRSTLLNPKTQFACLLAADTLFGFFRLSTGFPELFFESLTNHQADVSGGSTAFLNVQALFFISLSDLLLRSRRRID